MLVYTVHCTLYTVHCVKFKLKLSTVHLLAYLLYQQCTVHILATVQCIKYTLYSVQDI